MKKVVSGDIVFTLLGGSYDKARAVLGLAYRLRGERLEKIRSKVDVVSENVLSGLFDVTDSDAAERIGTPRQESEISNIIPSGGIETESSTFIQIGDDTIPTGEDTTSPVPPVVPLYRTGVSVDVPKGRPTSGPRSEFVNIGGTTVPVQPVDQFVRSFGTVQASSSSRASSSGAESSARTNLSVPSVDQGEIERVGALEAGDSGFPEAYLPPYILDGNEYDLFSEQISFRPRLSIHKSNQKDGELDIYNCRLKIPGLMDLVEQTGRSTRDILVRLEEFETISPFVVYLLGIKGVIEEVIAANKSFLDYQFDFSLMDVDDPEISDLTITPKYHFYDAQVEKNMQGWNKEPAVPNFYFMGKESGGFSLKNIDYVGARGTEFSSVMVVSSQEEMKSVNNYFTFKESVPFGVEIESDCEYSRFSRLLGEQKLLKQFGMNLASPNRGLTYFCDRRNVAIGSGNAGMLYSADTFKTQRWLEALYDKEAHLYTTEQASATVFSLLPIQEQRGVEQNKTLRSGQAKNVLLSLEKDLMQDTRGLMGCLENDNARRERIGFQVNKIKTGIVQKLFGLSASESPSRMLLFDSQLFYGQPYTYEALGIYHVFANQYHYSGMSDRPVFDVEKLELFFSIKMKPSAVAVVLPNFAKRVKIVSALPLPPTVRVEQYRDINSDKADVLFLFKNTTDTTEGDFVQISSTDSVFANFVRGSFEPGKVPFGNDDPIVKIEAYKLNMAPTSWNDFEAGEKTEISNVQTVGDKTTILDSNSFLDKIELDKDFYYVFRQIDIHGMVSNPTNVFQIRATKTGSRYRIICRDWEMEEFLAAQKPKTHEFKTARRFVCVLPNEEWMKHQTGFSKQYRLRLVSTQSKRVVSVDFEVKMAASRETY